MKIDSPQRHEDTKSKSRPCANWKHPFFYFVSDYKYLGFSSCLRAFVVNSSLAAIALLVILTGCSESSSQDDHSTAKIASSPDAPATQPVDPAWVDIDKALDRHGVIKDGIQVFTIPRDDLDVTIDGMGIPSGAGIASTFYFYRCPCGKMNVTGQFVTTDYESNDVADALRKNAAMNVASMSPMLLYDRPHLVAVRFQGEGEPSAMAGVLREALRWTGKERMAPEPAPKTRE